MRDTDNFEVQFMNGNYVRAVETGETAATARTIPIPVLNTDEDVRYEYIPTYWRTEADDASNDAATSATTFTLTTDYQGEPEWEEAFDVSDYIRINTLYDEVDRQAIDRFMLAQEEYDGFVDRNHETHANRVTIDENGNVRINWGMFDPVAPPEEQQSEESQPDFEDEKGGSLDDFLDSFSGD